MVDRDFMGVMICCCCICAASQANLGWREPKYVAILDFILGSRGLVPLPERPQDSSYSTLMCPTLALFFTCNLSFQTPRALQEAPNSAPGLFCILWKRYRENLLPFCPLAAIHLFRCTPESLKTTQITDLGISRAGLKGLVPPRWCQGATWERFQLLPLQLSGTQPRGFPAFLKISLLMEIFGLIN